MTTPGGTDAGQLRVRIVTDATGVQRDVERSVQGATDAAVDGTERARRSVAERAAGIGAAASVGLTLPLAAAAKTAADTAADVIEAQNKVGVVFGENADAVEEFAKRSARDLGVSRREALGAAGDFGALFRTLGFTQEASAKLSTQLVRNAADLASFNNASPEEALAALQSGLAGEAEPLKRFGIFMSEARVQAEAFASGLAKPTKNAAGVSAALQELQRQEASYREAVKARGVSSTEAAQAMDRVKAAENALGVALEGNTASLTEQQKAQLRYNIIQKDGALAAGDFGRSLESSVANQRKQSAALAEDAQVAYGERILPLFQQATVAAGKLAGGFGMLPGPVQQGVVVIGLLLALIGPLSTGIAAVAGAYTFLTTSTVASTAATTASTVAARAGAVAMRALGVAVRFATGPVGIVITLLGTLAAGLVYAYRNSETFRRIVQGALSAVSTYARTYLNAVIGLFRALGNVGSAVAGGIAGAFGRVTGALGSLVNGVRGAMRAVLNLLRGVRLPAFSVGVGPIRYNFPGLAPFAGLPHLATGGVVPATPGGRLAVVGEGRHDEAVVPLDGSLGERLGLSGGQLTVNVYNPVPEPAGESVNQRLRRLAALGVVDAGLRGAAVAGRA